MRVVAPAPDLPDRFAVVVDPDAEPVDLDEALLDFLDKIVERRLAAKAAPEQQAG
jgi:hypothetical protein